MKAQILVDTVAGTPDQPERVVLEVRYDKKIGRIDLPVPAPLFEREPAIDAFRRELRSMLTAVTEWERAQENIQAERKSDGA
jgi:hypothetical protein